jgi:flagellar basal body-associated protein FliL
VTHSEHLFQGHLFLPLHRAGRFAELNHGDDANRDFLPTWRPMAEEEKEATPAKKGGGSKIVIIAICATMLVTGGFFGLRLRGGGAKVKEPKLGQIEQIKEFLVNLQDEPRTYLRTEMAFQFDESFKKEDLDKNLPVIQDTVINILSDQRVSGIRSIEGKDHLKRLVAHRVNDALVKAGLKVDTKSKPHPEWDSDNGPVLKVYFITFAFQ